MEKITPIRERSTSWKRLELGARINARFPPIRTYLKHIALLPLHAEQRLDNEIEAIDPQLLDDAKFLALDMDEREHIRDEFQKLQCISIAIMTVSFFERCLNEFCLFAANPTLLSFDDIRGNGIVRASTFLSKVCGVFDPFASNDWKAALQIAHLRNHWVHAHEYMSAKQKHVLAQKVSLLPGLSWQEYEVIPGRPFHWVLPTSDFCIFSVDTLERMSWSILESIWT